MPACRVCGGPIVRKPRNFAYRILDRALYKCEQCDARIHRRRALFTIFNRYCECPKCGGHDLTRLQSKDRIDAITQNPFRRLLKLAGAPLYHCTFCRYQFRDWRKRDPNMLK
jgi:DNA-directed RNA polymerase subunit RPC12/RpoP